ncbi:uncharacterized protein LOC111295372 isoform X4 [Durio zibethinus]|uniref:Probable DNA helicase MCM9 n=1 Tax=Durio zibethinus TaxID=66656 RepID=A0A6P5YWS3_DURZI|nr:uncharacterized protein LOC111295372 isoform X4 [Durio zibethinus]
MLVFYLISLPLTMGMVILTLKYFAGPDVPTYVFFTVGYTWFCSFSIIILVPADIWTTIIGHSSGGISFFWSLSYWSTFLLTWAVVPTIQGYEDAGDFTMAERLKTSIHGNLVFYLCVGSIGLVGLILFIIFHKNWSGGILGFAMACSNTFGLVTGAFLLGFGLSEIPKGIWKNVDWTIRQKVLSHKVAKMAVKLDDAHQEFSNSIVVVQATSNQISKRDPLRQYMNIIDSMLHQMLNEDPSFKPQGGRFGENDMDYDTDEKSMATLRRRLRIAREEYCRYRRYNIMCEYMSFVLEALELEDTIKNYERRDATGWKFVSSLRLERTGKLGSSLDKIEFIWRCVLRKQLEKLLAIILGCMSAAILLAEATILPSGVDLSLFSILINSVGKQEMLVQVAAFVPLMYMCICTYYSLFKIGMLMFYSFTPRRTSSVSLLMICSMVARYAPPISYNFLNLIHVPGNRKTIFEKRMGNIDDAVPFFGKGFNKIYPLIMVIYTLLLVTNFFDRIIDYFGHWKIFKFQDEADDTDGFDPSGLIILQKERSWLERGHTVGEHVIPLARNFNGLSIDIEPGSTNTKRVLKDMVSHEKGVEKKFIHVRFNVCGSPLECPETFPSIGRVRVKHRGILLTLKGTVIRSGAVKMYEGQRTYQCKKCKHMFPLYPELETRNSITLPSICPSERSNPCEGTKFQCIESTTVCHDYQEIKIQESTQVLGVGVIPRLILVILQDDLVDTVKAGALVCPDDVIITGILTAKWSPDLKDVRCDLDPILIANHVRRTNELKLDIDIPDDVTLKFKQFWSDFRDTPLKGRNAILRGICPQVFGLFTVKLAVALTLIGGVQHVDASGTKIRGESHLLLVGDPGTGKSQFLKFAAKLSNRSVITTGLGSTSAGLTVTAVKDGGEWMLEAGALVLADGGLCCIDEFDSMREHDRATIHEAMEQQTISVAKAGLVTTLGTRTIVFGATNPKGHYDPDQPLSVNTTLSGPLLSRFDIVLVLLDTKNPEWDAVVSSHILAEGESKSCKKDEDLANIWPLPILRRYIHYVKEHFKPVLTKEAEKVISSYYQLQRRSATHNAARTTVRMLESLIRLAQAAMLVLTISMLQHMQGLCSEMRSLD